MAQTLVILNPISGNGNGEKVGPQIQAALREGGLHFDWARTKAPRHAIALAEQAKRDGYDTVIAVGGDGIVHEVINGILRASGGEANGTFGVIPVGSTLELTDAKGAKHVLKGRAGPVVPLPFADEHGRVSVLSQSFGEYELDGVKGGYGTYETLRVAKS